MRGFVQEWVHDEATLERAAALLTEYMWQHMRLRNEIWGNPLSEERMSAIRRGEIAPLVGIGGEREGFWGTPPNPPGGGAPLHPRAGRGDGLAGACPYTSERGGAPPPSCLQLYGWRRRRTVRAASLAGTL